MKNTESKTKSLATAEKFARPIVTAKNSSSKVNCNLCGKSKSVNTIRAAAKWIINHGCIKAKTLWNVKHNPGSQAWEFPQSQRRFLRILERESLIEWRCDNEGKNEGWYPCQPKDDYEHNSVHGRSKNK